MRQLVLAHGHDVAPAEQDVAGLVHGVGEQKPREFVAAGFLLGLHGGVALELRFGHQREERQHELVQGRHRRMGEDGGLRGVDAGGQVVHHHVVHVVLDVLGAVAVGDDLVVGDEHERVDAGVLHVHAVHDAAEVVPQMEPARGAVAGEHAVLAGVLGYVGARLVAALEVRFKTVDAHGVSSSLWFPFVASCVPQCLMADGPPVCVHCRDADAAHQYTGIACRFSGDLSGFLESRRNCHLR